MSPRQRVKRLSADDLLRQWLVATPMAHRGSHHLPPPPSPTANSAGNQPPLPQPPKQPLSTPSVALKPNSSAGASSSDSKPRNPSSNNPNPNSNMNHPTPKRGNPNPSPSTAHYPNSPPRGPIPPPGAPFSLPDQALGPPPPPSYGFHMLDRRTAVLADGSAHTYLALPPDYQDFIPPQRPLDHMARFPPSGPDLGGRFPPFGPISPNRFRGGEDQFMGNRNPNPIQDYWDSLGLDGRHGGAPEGPMKRKFGEVEGGVQDELARQRQHVLQYGNVGAGSSPFKREDEFSRASKAMRVGVAFDTAVGAIHHYHSIDPAELKKAFLKFAKLLNENSSQKKSYLENAEHGPRHCIACKRSKDFPDVHGLVMHAYNSDSDDLRVDHLGLHKALCVLMGWNYMKPPDNSKAYQFLPADEASANQEDLIVWPPTVMVQNTSTGKGKEGRMEGLGNKAMDNIIRALGFPNGKSKALYNREGHLGIVLVRFSADQSGLREAIQLSEHFEKKNHGRRGWAHVQSTLQGRDDENNPNLVKVDPITREKKRIYYGHLLTAFDLDKTDYETKKKAVLESKKEYLLPK